MNFNFMNYSNLNSLQQNFQAFNSYPYAKKSANFENNQGQKKKITRMKFTPKEDEELIGLVSLYGDQNWVKISEEISKKNQNTNKLVRTARQCKERYVNYLNPNLDNKEWTREEDECLLLNLLTTKHNFKTIKNIFPQRSEIAIRNRFNYLHRAILRTLKPTIANNISSIKLYQKNGQIEIADFESQDDNKTEPGAKNESIASEQTQNLNQFFLDLNPSYLNLLISGVSDFCLKNNSNISQPQLSNDSSSVVSKMPDLNINYQNCLSSFKNFNQNAIGTNMKKYGEKDIRMPQQWIEAANTIIKAVKTDEVKNNISELKQKAESLNAIIGNRAQQNNINSLFSFISESDNFDEDSFYGMFD